MVALVTLSESSKGKLKHLLNNLNLGIAAADFGTHFVNLLDTGTTDTSITDAQASDIGRLLNNLNLGTAKLGFGDLMQAFLHSQVQREAAAQALTPHKRAELVRVLNNLNLGLADIGFGDIVDQAVVAVIAGITPPAPVKTISAKTGVTAAAGATVTFAQMFDVGTGGAVATDFDYVVSPVAGSKGGAVAPTTGVLTLDADATGTVTVTATAKAGQTITGSPSTCSITIS